MIYLSERMREFLPAGIFAKKTVVKIDISSIKSCSNELAKKSLHETSKVHIGYTMLQGIVIIF